MFFKKKQDKRTYDKENQKPVIRSSICTGERVAGFQDIHTGKFTDIMLIRTSGDLKEFCHLYSIDEADLSTQY